MTKRQIIVNLYMAVVLVAEAVRDVHTKSSTSLTLHQSTKYAM